jgi:hypothetical protein
VLGRRKLADVGPSILSAGSGIGSSNVAFQPRSANAAPDAIDFSVDAAMPSINPRAPAGSRNMDRSRTWHGDAWGNGFILDHGGVVVQVQRMRAVQMSEVRVLVLQASRDCGHATMASDPDEFVTLTDHGPMKLRSAVSRATTLLRSASGRQSSAKAIQQS